VKALDVKFILVIKIMEDLLVAVKKAEMVA
jgi:hypothetical protein